jgi:hypothetical protein
LPFGSFLEALEAGPVELLFAWAFLTVAAAFTLFACDLVLSDLTAGFTTLVTALGFAPTLAVAFEGVVFLEEADFLDSVFLSLGALLAPVLRVVFFGAIGAFAT